MGHTEATAEVIEFARACGQRRPVQLVLNPVFVNDRRRAEREPTVHRLERPFVLIGRAADCDVRLRHPDVSYRHAYLQIVGGRALCVDLASRSGTRWKTGTQSYGWIEPGEDVGIGPFELSYRGEEGEPIETEGPGFSEETRLLPAAALEFLNGRDASDKPRLWPLRRSLSLVGASPACSVQLRHESVSKVHSSLVLTPAGLWVVDLLGRHGTRVNGAAVRCGRLHDGDELRIGRFRMIVRLGDSMLAAEWCDSPSRAIPTHSVVPAPETQPRDDRLELADPAPGPCGEAPAAQPAPSALTKHGSARATSSHPSLSAPSPPANGDARPPERMYSEAFILRLMDQFAAMQQQAMEHSQQMMMMMVQLFSSIHEGQQELVREELARVHEINRQLQELQSTLVRQQADQQLMRRAAPAAGETSGQDRENPAATHPETTEESEISSDPVNESPTESPAIVPEHSAAPLDAGEDLAVRTEEITGRETPDAEACSPTVPVLDETAEAAEDLSDVVPLDESADDEDHPDDSSTLEHPDAETHAWLAEQIHQLEREREGRWRKVLRMVGAGRL